jgi:hypothetical protein
MDRAMSWTRSRREMAAAYVFLLAAVLAGITPVEKGVEYHAFGMLEGVLALLLGYLLVLRGVWPRPRCVTRWAVLIYGVVATAQLLGVLLPPPGLVQWVVVAGVAVSAWGAFSGSRRRLVASLGTLAVMLALVRYSVIPVLWQRIGPAAGTAFGLGDVAESGRRIFADWHPTTPAAQLVAFLAVCGWALGTYLAMEAETDTDELAA